MATERLHLRDSLLLEFEARVAGASTFEGKPSLALDRTAFYAEAGGQLGDRGRLETPQGELTVVDVQIDDAGDVHHLLAAPPPELIGAAVHGRIDEAHRRDQMSQHTGQHMLSRAFMDVAGLETVSAHLGSEDSTIDLATPTLSADVVSAAEDQVNRAVLEDRPILIHFPTTDELRAMPLRRTPKVDKDIRVIQVEGFDFTPCGGTHCLRTGMVGFVRIIGQERYKGMTRMSFLAGSRTFRHLRKGDAVIRELSQTLSSGRDDLPAAASRLRADLKAEGQALGQVRAELMRFVAKQLLDAHPADASGTTRVHAVRESDDIDALRVLAGELTKRPDVAAFVTSRDRGSGDWLVVVRRGASASFDAGKWVKTLAAAHGARGGGRPEHAEGRLPGALDASSIRLA